MFYSFLITMLPLFQKYPLPADPTQRTHSIMPPNG